ncbi:MAG: nitrilase family protein [Pseudomonadota bacterium]
MPDHLRIATVQFQHRAADADYNLSTITHFAHRARAEGAHIVAFPEMCVSGYWHIPKLADAEIGRLAEPVDGPSITHVAALSIELGLGIGVGWLEMGEDQRLYNAYRLCLPDGSGHTHRKLHAFEHRQIASGDSYTVFDTPWRVKVAILICWDNNLVENVRACALMGAELLLAPHQTGGTDSLSPYGMKPIPQVLWDRRHIDPGPLQRELAGPNGRDWLMRWLPARAHDNGMFIAFSNGIGADHGEIRTGNAMILDPYGRILAESAAPHDDMVAADLDLGLIATSSGRRWLRGRRPALYHALTEPQGNEQSARMTRFGEA